MSPPSVNHYWMANGKRRYISAKGKAFQKMVGLFVKAKHSPCRLKMSVVFHFPDRMRRDIDNHLKALLDSLVKAGLCLEIIVKRGNVIKGGLVELEVWEI
ncbi:RusA family crossover junction endodeoxyribonuclease [Acinetobacter pittii]|uniref:RusA family crossover junction endodeoxyribonuclease n=1 Tax=Acinetobacter pittii TaxID=48296 RepID=UPI001D188EBD|nr:RusA family crossover junction endodeoxyribonuclease [Acinetobacter pittii]